MRAVRIMGGLGNQLFQYALALVLARGGAEAVLELHFRRDRYKREYALDFLPVRLPFATRKQMMLARAKWDARLLRGILRLPEPLLVKDGGDWRRFINSPIKRNAHFVGYWQSAALAEMAGELLTDLRNACDALPPPPEMADGAQNIAVHARRLWEHDSRGKLVRRKKGKPPPALRLPLSYYENAFAAMREKFDTPRFLIFGDSPQWCEENILPLAHPDEAAVMPPGTRPDWQDMLMMAKCRGHVVSNSTFSWWAAKIGGGHAVAPQTWSGNHERDAEIYPPEWEMLAASV